MSFETIGASILSKVVTSMLFDDKPDAVAAPAPAALPPPAAVVEAPVVPVVEPVTEMPATPNKSDAVKAAKRKSIAEQVRRRGRASTILTDAEPAESLGA